MQQDDNEFHIPYESMTLEEIIELIKRGARRLNEKHHREARELKAVHSRMQDEADRLTQDFISGLISVEEYTDKQRKLSNGRSAVLQDIAEYDSADDGHCRFLIKLMKNVYENVKSYKGSVN